MIHDLSAGPSKTLPLRPAARLGYLILSECLGGGYSKLRLFESESPTGDRALGVQYFVEGAWKDVMKIPAAAGVPVVVHLRSMCEIDPVHHPDRKGTFRVRNKGEEASITAHFTRTADGFEEVELHVTPHPVGA